MNPQPQQAIFMGRGTIRPPKPADHPTLRWLLRGLHEHSTAQTLENIFATPQPRPSQSPGQNHTEQHTQPSLYVAELDRHITGLAAILTDARDSAAFVITVDSSHPSAPAIYTRLAEVALATARDSGYLKLWIEAEPTTTHTRSLFKRFGYMPHRNRFVDGHCRSEFVLDLYHQINPEEQEPQQPAEDQPPSRSATA